MHKIVINNCYGGFDLSTTALQWLKDEYGLKNEDFTNISRHDHRLVKCVEHLGKIANGPYSNLNIIEIEGNQYRIEVYDGKERVVVPPENWIVIE